VRSGDLKNRIDLFNQIDRRQIDKIDLIDETDQRAQTNEAL
jgi:hypothetical protein